MLLALLLSFVPFVQSPDRIVETFPDGKPRFECEARRAGDGSLVRHGKSKSWHANGKLAAEGSFVDGRETGAWTFHFESGKRQSTGSFENGEREGLWKFWRDGGAVELEGKYEAGLRNGEWTRFEGEKRKPVKFSYQVVDVVDPVRAWTWRGTVGDGELDGRWTCRRANGVLVVEGEFARGAMHGPWLFWHADGTFDDGWISAQYDRGERGAPIESDPRGAGAPRLATAPSIAIRVQSEWLEPALAGDEAALAKLLEKASVACEASASRLVELNLALPEDLDTAKRIHERVLAPVLGSHEEWPKGLAAQQKLVRRWISVVELLSGDAERGWFKPFELSLRWGTAHPRRTVHTHPLSIAGAPGTWIPPLPSGALGPSFGIGGGVPQSPGRLPRHYSPSRRLKQVGGLETEAPRLAAVEWLAGLQQPDGSWDPAAGGGSASARLATTAQCLLALRAEGNSIGDGERAGAMLSGARWLASQQSAEGRFGAGLPEGVYQHAIATYAMSDLALYSVTPSSLESTERAVRHLLEQRLSDGSWPSEFGGTTGDVSTTITACLALLSSLGWNPGFDLDGFSDVDGARSLAWLIAQAATLQEPNVPLDPASIPPSGSATLLSSIALLRLFARHDPTSKDFAGLLAWLDLQRDTLTPRSVPFLAVQGCVSFVRGGEQWEFWNKALKVVVLADKSPKLDKLEIHSTAGGRLQSVIWRIQALQCYSRFSKPR